MFATFAVENSLLVFKRCFTEVFTSVKLHYAGRLQQLLKKMAIEKLLK